jgi:hypothetical protein
VISRTSQNAKYLLICSVGRCWTLQEQILSTRSLYFASHTLQWRCSRGVRNLGGSLHLTKWQEYSIQDMKYGASYPFQSNLECWAKIVYNYSLRSMTFSSDKLKAIAAIAQEFAPMLGPQGYVGIWGKSLLSLHRGPGLRAMMECT